MAIKDRIAKMGFGLPDFGAIESKLDSRFEELVAELHTMQGILGDILAELRTQRGGQP